jgi:VanZ family protein
MGLITMSSAVPGQDMPQVVDDRVAHFVVYAGLGILMLFSVAGFVRPRLAGRHVLLALAIVAAFAAADEWHQSFVPGRDSSAKDFLFDVLGAGAAQSAVWSALRWRR